MGNGLLLDGDRRAQAFDIIDVRPLHESEKLAGIGGKALDVPALALGIDGIECEARFAGARETGDHNQPVARHFHVNILQVMDASALNDELILFHLNPVVNEHEWVLRPSRRQLSRFSAACGDIRRVQHRTASRCRGGCNRYYSPGILSCTSRETASSPVGMPSGCATAG